MSTQNNNPPQPGDIDARLQFLLQQMNRFRLHREMEGRRDHHKSGELGSGAFVNAEASFDYESDETGEGQ
jgi:hypothetical protein